jgi:hypothetical protein
VVEKNPAIQAFIQHISKNRVWGQVLVERVGENFRLRHVADRDLALENLRPVTTESLRELAMYGASGEFRPLRAAPDLQRGWVWTGRSSAELGPAIHELYPASIVDWFAAEQGAASPTDYREFTNRQTGMYRITQLLTDEQAGQVIRACCASGFCLKRRLWTVEGLKPDAASGKSAIPCLEPCAILLELARKSARLEQEEKITIELSPSDLETFLIAARSVVEGQGGTERAGNIGSAANPRRIQLVLEKYGKAVDGEKNRKEE